MMKKPIEAPQIARRRFLSSCCRAAGVMGTASVVTDLKMIGSALAQGPPPTDYKALVCLYLGGGNDGANMILPRSGPEFSQYVQDRSNLAIPGSQMLSISPATSDGRTWALHPSMVELQSLFSGGDLAVVANVGTLLAPLTKAEWEAGSVAVPPQLFSHSDQSTQWQTSVPDSLDRTGWGGRMADATRALNTNGAISMSISLNGTNVFQVGREVFQYHVTPSGGSVSLDGFRRWRNDGEAHYQALRNILDLTHENLLEQEFANIMNRAIANDELLSTSLENAPDFTQFPDTSLGRQLGMIARLISISDSLSMKRQIFFCQIGGFDTHGAQLGPHAGLMNDLSESMGAFHAAMTQINKVDEATVFTASEFGRTFNSNGQGSDHGWGAPHVVMGGAVNGGDIYGTMPQLETDGPDDTGRGRWIPSMSVDEYSATMAKWFGVSPSDMQTVFPNLSRFATPDVGFMQPA
ncbi:MAG: hypothetical protein ACI8UO_002594 [Verrucomicrobiales bacterium]|jgi:uncharacterized protein (DUF1501 family)